MTDPTVHSVAVKLAALEERMNTKHAEYKTDIAMLAAENSKRHVQLIVVILAALGLAVGIIKWLP